MPIYKSKGVTYMIQETAMDFSASEVFVEMNNGEFLQFDMTLPIQMLFDDVFTFVSKTDFDN